MGYLEQEDEVIFKKDKTFVYSGGEVSMRLLQDALEFLILMEPDPEEYPDSHELVNEIYENEKEALAEEMALEHIYKSKTKKYPEEELMVRRFAKEVLLERIYENNTKKYAKEIKMAKEAIREYGQQIFPKTLENMQREFYSILDSKYNQSTTHCSVVYSSLNSGWDKIGPWRS